MYDTVTHLMTPPQRLSLIKRGFPLVLLLGLAIFVNSFIFAQSRSVISRSLTRREYIGQYKDLAMEQMKKYRIPASIILAQGCLESSDGNSRLAREANNHFGIKCHDWDGEKIFHDDDERNECFRKYPDVETSYEDHSLFLTERDRYRFLFSLAVTDYREWAHGLGKAGYATDPAYARHLIRIIEEYNLAQFDTLSSQVDYSLRDDYKPGREKKSGESYYSIVIGRTINKINGLTFIIAGSGDNYDNLAKEYSLFKKELLKFNDLPDDTPPAEGTIIFLERKKRDFRGPQREHNVEPGETMHMISQLYGIRLKELTGINPQFNMGKEPQPGDLIKLKRR
ncbi:MAG: glucosaminidase domain-containing protein [Bacteroidales bacterium]|nr:glucosaminidase domain-containing protein [Bacteroidales bacterium]MDD4638808.1 glucosaminidase domain-containing protein [Bacteroidales bacterium]